MNNFLFYSPTKIVFGKDSHLQIGQIINDYGYRSVLLVYGSSSLKSSGVLDEIKTSLSSYNIRVFELSQIESNPKLSKVYEGLEIVKNNKIDLVLGAGGGSVIDTAKAISNCAFYDGDPWDLFTKKFIPTKHIPVGVILTISAAGSELSNSCVITNDKLKIKAGCNTDLNRPLFAILNPNLTLSVSKFQTACGICDMFMHTLERFLTDSNTSTLVDGFALTLLKNVYNNGIKVMNNLEDYEARSELMLSSSFAHNGLTGLGSNFYFTVHKLEHEISGTYDYVNHASGLSVLYYGYAMHEYKHLVDRFYIIAKDVFGVKTKDIEKGAVEGIERTREFFKMLGLPVSLNEIGIYEDSFEEMANRLTLNGTLNVVGFHPLNKQDIIEIFNIVK